VGLFGSDLFGNVNRIGDAVVKQARSPTSTESSSRSELKKTDTTRGAMTRLTRKEINLKLQQIPVFFAVEEGATETILLQDGIGRLFIEKTDADRFIGSLQSSNKNIKVATTTLDEVRNNIMCLVYVGVIEILHVYLPVCTVLYCTVLYVYRFVKVCMDICIYVHVSHFLIEKKVDNVCRYTFFCFCFSLS
jgi:hypothetical protein